MVAVEEATAAMPSPLAVNQTGQNGMGNASFELPIWLMDYAAYWELVAIVIGAPTNLLLIVVWLLLFFQFGAGRRSRSKNRWFILSMAVSDLLFLTVRSPIMYAWYSDNLDMTRVFCYFMYGANHLCATVSSIQLLLLNIDKFIFLHWPLHYHSIMTQKLAIVLSLIGWLVGIVWAVIFLFGPFVSRSSECGINILSKTFYVVFVVVFFLMPILLSAAISFYIATVAIRAQLSEMAAMARSTSYHHHHHQKLNGQVNDQTAAMIPAEQSNGGDPGPNRSPWRTITYVFSATVWAMLTCLPYRFSLLFASHITTISQATGQFTLLGVMVMNPAGNPIITLLTQPHYRRLLTDWLCSVYNLCPGRRKQSPTITNRTYEQYTSNY